MSADPQAPFIPRDPTRRRSRPALAGLRHPLVLPALARAGRLEHRRLDRPHRDPRHRRPGLRQLRRRGQPRDDRAGRARLLPRHARRRAHRPVRPPHGDDRVRHRARRRCCSCCRSSRRCSRSCSSRSGSRSSRCSGAPRRTRRSRTSSTTSSWRRRTRCRWSRRSATFPLASLDLLPARRACGVARLVRPVPRASSSTRRRSRCSSTRARSSCRRCIVWRLPIPTSRGEGAAHRASRTAARVRDIKEGMAFIAARAAGPGRHRRPRRRPHRRRGDDPARARVRQARGSAATARRSVC